jgi:hypothetical protein
VSAETFLGLWATAGAEASRAFDADGLPQWGRHPEHGWHHASASAVALAEEAAAHGFDLPAFDCWLSALPAGFAKVEALRHRAAALDCVRADDLDRVRLLRHLTEMLRQWQVQALLPLARRDAKRQAGTRKPRRPDLDEWIAGALKRAPAATRDELWQRAPQWVRDEIGIDRFKKRVSAARAASK